MKTNKILLFLAAALCLSAVESCQKDFVPQNPYERNVGEEFLSVGSDSLLFLGRGGSLTFTVQASYDAAIVADEWIHLSSQEVPGDGRTYTVTASTEANSVAGGTDRTGLVTITTKSMKKSVFVLQPYYSRPAMPESIATADDLVYFLGTCAPAVEEGEVFNFSADINMEGKTLISAESFKGVLNGNGFKITNLKAGTPLVLTNRGVINGLTIDASCSFEISANAGGDTYFGPFAAHNYGSISECTNAAKISFTGATTTKTYIGGIAGYHYADAKITSCRNRGEILYAPQSTTANAYIGGITPYSYGNIELCEIWGPINCNPASNSGVYFMGGITGRQQEASLSGNIVHKDARIYTNTLSGSGKSYIGGIVGYVEGTPKTSDNQVYSDIEINLAAESYIGALQGWQAKVDNASKPSATLFEGSIVNSNITAYTKGKGANGNNPCNSAGFVTGRFSGQSGKATTLHYGTPDKPIKVSGSLSCIQSGTKKTASAGDYQALLDGDGSKSSVNIGAIPEADYANIIYQVCGDGQTGDPEDMIVKTDAVKLSVPAEGGEAGFNVRGNYQMSLSTEDDWICVEPATVPGDGTYHAVVVTALANDHTYAREGQVIVSMPMGSKEFVTITQAGNKTLPATLEVDVESLVLDPAGQSESIIKVTANYDATLTSDADWVIIEPGTVVGDETAKAVSITGEKNKSGAVRTATLTITNKDQVRTVSLSQDKFVVPTYSEIRNADEFIEFIENAFDKELYPEGKVTTLKADIDLKGKTFSAPASYAGTFDADGKSIKNWVCTAPLFGNLTGTVKNLTIDKSCSVELNDIIATFLVNNNSGTIENCTNNASMNIVTKALGSAAIRVAPFAAINAGGVVRGCVNNGGITFGNEIDDEQATYLGGMTGSSTGGAFENCTNNAPITINYNGTKKAYKRIGGMTAICQTSATTFNGCVNTVNGKITILDNTATPLLTNVYGGGMVGEISAKMVSEMKNCRSFGDLYTNVANDAARLGGMWATAGNWATDDMTLLEGCAVNCNITAVHPSKYGDTYYNPLNSCGLVVGRLGGEKKTLYLGTVDNPVKVAGTITRLKTDGSVDVTLTFDGSNMALCCGDGSATTANGQGSIQIINAKYEAVTKE